RYLHSFPTRRSSDLEESRNTNSANASRGSTKDPTDAIQTITESREMARAAAQNLAVNLKGKPEINNAARLYNAAMAKNSGYVNRSEEHTSELQSRRD